MIDSKGREYDLVGNTSAFAWRTEKNHKEV
jgi:hypothetical protein